ncbi:hypothetical protein FCV38_02600 [Clostridium sporogenes]|nr:hypothetical protein [Clostridium sporogenes]
MRGLYSKEYLIDELKKEAIKLGRVPKQEEFKHGARCRARFGSWKNALELAKLDTSHLPKKYTDEELLQQIKNKAQELGRIPKSYEVRQGIVIINRFGSWINALKLAGFSEEEFEKSKRIKSYARKYKKYTDEDLLKQIRDKYKELKRIPTTCEVDNYVNIIRRFKGWKNALRKAGFSEKEINSYNKKYTKQELLHLIKEKSKELNRIPTIREMGKLNYHFCKIFGTWENALLEAGFSEEDIKHRREKYTNEDLLKMLKEEYIRLGEIPKACKIKQYKIIVKRFGSFDEALKKANLI